MSCAGDTEYQCIPWLGHKATQGTSLPCMGCQEKQSASLYFGWDNRQHRTPVYTFDRAPGTSGHQSIPWVGNQAICLIDRTLLITRQTETVTVYKILSELSLS